MGGSFVSKTYYIKFCAYVGIDKNNIVNVLMSSIRENVSEI